MSMGSVPICSIGTCRVIHLRTAMYRRTHGNRYGGHHVHWVSVHSVDWFGGGGQDRYISVTPIVLRVGRKGTPGHSPCTAKQVAEALLSVSSVGWQCYLVFLGLVSQRRSSVSELSAGLKHWDQSVQEGFRTSWKVKIRVECLHFYMASSYKKQRLQNRRQSRGDGRSNDRRGVRAVDSPSPGPTLCS